MITKVALGVALLLIEFSIIVVSQNNSLSLSNETLPSSTTPATVDLSNLTTTTIATTESYDTTATTDFLLPENCSSYKVS